MLDEESYTLPKWQVTVLRLAGIYNILWGALVTLFPHVLFTNFGMPQPTYLIFWQVIGMFVGVLGIGYLIAATDPRRHWPLVMTGFLIKSLAFLGFVAANFQGGVSSAFWYAAIFNNLIWLYPFGAILMDVYRHWVLEIRSLEEERFMEEHFHQVRTNQGSNLQEMSHQWPVLLVFLRSFGCTFCRETLADLAYLREDLERSGKALVIVHMSDEDQAELFMSQYGLRNVHHISDKQRNIYRYFGLRRGFLPQVLGLKNWLRFLDAGIKRGFGIGKFEGDGFQMPGVFLYYKGCIKKKYVHQSAADRPNYQEIIEYELQPSEAVQ